MAIKVFFDYILDDLRLKDTGGVWEESTTVPDGIYYDEGYVGIGTDTPAYPLDVNGNMRVTNTIYSNNNHLLLEAASGKYVEIKPRNTLFGMIIRGPTTSHYGNIRIDEDVLFPRLMIGYDTNSTMVGIDSSAYIYSRRLAVGIVTEPEYGIQLFPFVSNAGRGYADAWISASDGRYKVEDKTYVDGLGKIMSLAPVSFNWLDKISNENGSIVPGSKLKVDRSIGFIAQDMYKVIPELCCKPEDETKELWGIDYAKLTTVLVSAVQEQQVQINKMSRQILNLEGMLKKLEILRH